MEKENSRFRVYTKTGDSGKTSLASGTRVGKDHPRLDAYGTIDELNSFTGLLINHFPEHPEKGRLTQIQNRLFVVSSTLAVDDPAYLFRLPTLTGQDIYELEKAMDQMMDQMPDLNHFILPGGTEAASLGHVCRTICRRAERRMISLSAEITIDPMIIQYVNRLSDYFFVLSRFANHLAGIGDNKWTSDFRDHEK